MSEAAFLFNITPIPVLSVLVWLFLCILAMYLARRPFHRAMESTGHAVNHFLRMLATAVKLGEQRLNARNREVLVASGRAAAERRIEREFTRMGQALEHGLAHYPQLQRQIREHLQKLEKDYQRSEDVPQRLSDWVRVIDAIAAIQPPGDPMVASILETIHTTLENQHRTALDDYRKSMSRRHTILARMAPRWQTIGKALDRIETAIQGLTERTRIVDRAMDGYQALRDDPQTAHGRLFTSALTRFFGAAIALSVFAVGAVLNFNLVALPMTEMVGGNSFIGPFNTAHVAGGFIVGMVLVVGMFLTDTLRITRFFHAIGTLDRRSRNRLLWGLTAVLVILAGVESSLAFMRDRIIADTEALRQSLNGIDPPVLAANRIAVLGQTVLGFIMPFFLSTVAIPLDAFLSALRTVMGTAVAWVMRCIAVTLRLTGNLARYLTLLVNDIYYLMIFPALWLETLAVKRWTEHRATVGQSAGDRAPATETATMLSGKAPCKKSSD